MAKHPLRIYSHKLNTLLGRIKKRNNIYPHEFMKMMSENEIDTYFNEVRKSIVDFGVCPDKNPIGFNKLFNSLLDDRDDTYKYFKTFH